MLTQLPIFLEFQCNSGILFPFRSYLDPCNFLPEIAGMFSLSSQVLALLLLQRSLSHRDKTPSSQVTTHQQTGGNNASYTTQHRNGCIMINQMCLIVIFPKGYYFNLYLYLFYLFPRPYFRQRGQGLPANLVCTYSDIFESLT